MRRRLPWQTEADYPCDQREWITLRPKSEDRIDDERIKYTHADGVTARHDKGMRPVNGLQMSMHPNLFHFTTVHHLAFDQLPQSILLREQRGGGNRPLNLWISICKKEKVNRRKKRGEQNKNEPLGVAHRATHVPKCDIILYIYIYIYDALNSDYYNVLIKF